MDHVVIKMTEGGRIVIPAAVRKHLELSVGDDVVLLMKDHEATLLSRSEAIRRAQAIVSRKVPPERSLVKELLEERKRESRVE